MSRTAAPGVGRRGKTVMPAAISDLEFRQSMQGVHLRCEDRRSIKEEAPSAHKDIDRAVETVAGAGLARIVARMKPLAVLKGWSLLSWHQRAHRKPIPRTVSSRRLAEPSFLRRFAT